MRKWLQQATSSKFYKNLMEFQWTEMDWEEFKKKKKKRVYEELYLLSKVKQSLENLGNGIHAKTEIPCFSAKA